MSLLKPSLANTFLEQYKRLLCEIAGKQLGSINDYAEAREILYTDGSNTTYPMSSDYDPSFVKAIRKAHYGLFVYAKKYKQGYAFKSNDNYWFCVNALTTPLEEMFPEWIVVETALLPYQDKYICDGLIVDKHVSIGKNMKHEMIQELKVERSKWSSTPKKKCSAEVDRSARGGASSTIKINHIALWCHNIETMKAFYEKYFNAHANDKYTNHTKGFSSYFLSFDSGARLEIMQMASVPESKDNSLDQFTGYIHLAVSVGSETEVDALTKRLQDDGYEVLDGPRRTGDGYYESVVLDPEKNRIEITV